MNDPLFSNKIAGAILAALLLVFGLPQLTGAVMGGGHGGGRGDELHLAYCCVDLGAQDHTAADEPAPVDLGTLLANASISGGERRAALCKSCHTLDEGGADGTGPNLWNIVNRSVASVPGYNYSGALQAAGGVWSYDRLDEYLKNSKAYVPGTLMAQRFARDDQRADFLAYLGSLSASPAAFPAPTAAVEAPIEEAAAHGAELTSEITEIADHTAEIMDAANEVTEEVVEAAEDALQPEE